MPPVKERALSNFFSPSQNHLILVVGLIALACLISGLALSFASASLDAAQKWLLLSFMIFFPVVGLATSLWLILRHHRKLVVAENDEEITWQLAGPEDQRSKLNSEVIDLAASLGIPKQQVGDLRSAYIVAEDLALRRVEQESGKPMMRHIKIGDSAFDGVFVENDIVIGVEMIFMVKPDIAQSKIDKMLKKAEQASKKLQAVRPGSKFRFLLAIVTQLEADDEVNLRNLLLEKFALTPVDIDSTWVDFEGLQRTFAAD